MYSLYFQQKHFSNTVVDHKTIFFLFLLCFNLSILLLSRFSQDGSKIKAFYSHKAKILLKLKMFEAVTSPFYLFSSPEQFSLLLTAITYKRTAYFLRIHTGTTVSLSLEGHSQCVEKTSIILFYSCWQGLTTLVLRILLLLCTYVLVC